LHDAGPSGPVSFSGPTMAELCPIAARRATERRTSRGAPGGGQGRAGDRGPARRWRGCAAALAVRALPRQSTRSHAEPSRPRACPDLPSLLDRHALPAVASA